uniref:CBL-interacting protein kinase 1 n=1 Tax=Solanum tuberosum TaxID=4113 RepID=M1A011_SOLTU
MACCIQHVVVPTMLLLKFFLTEAIMVQLQILGPVVSFYMSFSLAFYPLMIEILQCFIKRLVFFFF